MTAIYTLTSPLHDAQAVDRATQSFLKSLGVEYIFRADDYSDYGSHSLDLIYVRTGGTEGLFRRILTDLRQRSGRPVYLLTSGESNSLAASMEILSFLRQHDITGEILHGSIEYISRRVQQLHAIGEALHQLNHSRLGVIGHPSDWLLSSNADRVAIRQQLEFVGLQGVNYLGFEIVGGAALGDDVLTEDGHLFVGEVCVGKNSLSCYKFGVSLT